MVQFQRKENREKFCLHIFLLPKLVKVPVLRILGVDPGSEFFPSLIRIFSIPDLKFFHPGSASASNNLSILTQKMVSKLSEI
jgi:hypothetical protein